MLQTFQLTAYSASLQFAHKLCKIIFRKNTTCTQIVQYLYFYLIKNTEQNYYDCTQREDKEKKKYIGI